MLSIFNKYCHDNQLFNATDKILLTVSGGRDSVFMVHLFLAAKLNFAIAHCNFNLRGDDAKLDEEFVKKIALKNNIPFYVTHFNTTAFATKNGISIQMAARELRYNWFEEIRKKNNYQFIATAHHKNDVAETMLINLVKGTGIAGLHGIINKKGKIIRPILCFNRKEIDNYIAKNNLKFREDKSNAETKYLRNNIRHKIIPALEKINPQLVETLNTESNQFLELEQIIAQKIEDEKRKCFKNEQDIIKIDIKLLLTLKPLSSYLYYFLQPYNFNISGIENIKEGLRSQSGKSYFSSTHILIKDRNNLLIQKYNHATPLKIEINKLLEFDKLPIKINAKKTASTIKIEKDKRFAYLDFNKIQFPLTLRKWKKGDVFQPLGMKGKKKLSDFFIDEKLSLFDKERVWLLTFKAQIIWVVGYRIDDKFKIEKSTKVVLTLAVET